MKLDTMREFLLLSVNRNFSKTAEELYIAQSALSRHISALERELGVQLVNRTHSTFALTAAGEIVAEEFKEILNRYQSMRQRLSMLSANFEGEFHVGGLYHNFDWYIYPIIDHFRNRYPKVKLCLHSYQPNQLVEDVVSGKLDMGFGNNFFVHMEQIFQYHKFWQVPLYVLFDPEHRLAAQETIRIEDLQGETMVSFQESEYVKTAKKMQKFLESHGIKMQKQIFLSNFDELPFQLKESGGVCVTPAQNPKLWDQLICSKPLECLDQAVDMLAFWRKDNENPAIFLMCNVLDTLYPSIK